MIYDNLTGIPIRADLLRLVEVAGENSMPGAVHIHGYQNKRHRSRATIRNRV